MKPFKAAPALLQTPGLSLPLNSQERLYTPALIPNNPGRTMPAAKACPKAPPAEGPPRLDPDPVPPF